MKTNCFAGSDVSIGETLVTAGADPKFSTDKFCVQFIITKRLLAGLKNNWDSFLCLLLNKGASPNEFTGHVSNLIKVTAQGKSQLVEELLKHGGDVNFADHTKQTALHYACILSKFFLNIGLYSDHTFDIFFTYFAYNIKFDF